MKTTKQIFAAIVILIIISGISISVLSNTIETDEEQGVLNNYGSIKFTDRSVVILGTSQYSDIIEDELIKCTSKIMFIYETYALTNISNDTILMIDGAWLFTVSLRNVADGIRPLILNGTPVIVLGETANILRFAVDDIINGGGSYNTDEGGRIYYSHFNGIIYDPDSHHVERREITDSYPTGLINAVSALYKWADDGIGEN